MAKILGRDSIKASVPKMVELTDEFIINGQVYNKSNMSPKPYKTLAIENAVSSLLDPIMYESAYVTNKSLTAIPRSKNSILVDSEDTNITYCVNNTQNGSSYFYKITKFNDNYRQEKVSLMSIASNYGGYSEIIDQDENYVYVFNNVGVDDVNAYNTRISQINKITMAVTVTNLNGGRSNILYKDNLYVYVGILSGTGAMAVYRYTKSSCALSKIYSVATANSSQFVIKPSMTKAYVSPQGIMTFYYLVDSITDGLHHLIFKKCTIDLSLLTGSVSDVTVDFNGLDNDEMLITAFSNYLNVVIEQIEIVANGKKYITLAPYTTGGFKTPNNINRLYTYEVINEDNFKLVSKEDLPSYYGTLLTINNNNTLALANANSVDFYKWDDSETRYKHTNTYTNEVSFISKDMNNIIWIQNKDTSVEQFSLSIPLEVYADFERETYEYDDEDIVTNVIAYAKNFGGEYIEASVKLTLTGNCYFAVNGNKTLVLSTSNVKPSEIPVVITGSSVIGVNTVLI